MKLVRENISSDIRHFDRTGDVKKSLSLGKVEKIRKWFESHEHYKYVIHDDMSVLYPYNLYLRKTGITELPDNLTVEGYLNISENPISELPENLIVKGYLNIRGTNIRELPKDLQAVGIIADKNDLPTTPKFQKFLRLEESKKENVQVSAGLLIIQDNKMLLTHPTGAIEGKKLGIPKGHVEEGETIKEAAIRETFEETGIEIDPDLVSEEGEGVLEYRDRHDKLYKKVHYFVVIPDKKITNDDIELLSPDEIDWAGFLDIEQARKGILWRQKELLQYLYE